MRNFFKKIAFVLSAAVIVSAVGPANVKAATEPTLKKSAKILYVGGDETGNIGDTYRFTFNNAKGYTATWKTSKKSVATVDAKAGNIQAVAVGTTKITATLKNKAGDAVERVATVYVKQNAEKIGFGSLAKVNKALAVGDTAKINVYRQVGATKVWAQSDKTLITDTVVWTSADPKVATVDKWGKVTAVAAGKTTITAAAVQNEGTVTVTSDSFDVEVKAGLTDAKQASINTISATFATDLSAVVKATDVKVYSMVGSTKVAVATKPIEFDKVDKTKATITTYTDLAKDITYVVEYAETSATFKGADLSVDAVAKLTITPATVTKGVQKDVVVKAYTANDVLIPATTVDSRITLSADISSKYYLDAANRKITIFNVNDTAAVKATFLNYSYATEIKEVKIEATAVITAVDAVTPVVNAVGAFTVYTGTLDFTKATSTSLSISDTTGYKVAAKTTDSLGNTVESIKDSLFTFESSDTSTLLINADNIYPLKTGEAVVIVKYNKVPVGTYTVTIGQARVATDVTATFDKMSLSASATAKDSIKLTVKTLDQYKADRTGVDAVTVTYVNGPANGYTAVPTATGTNKNEFVFDGANYVGKEGTYQYKVVVGNQTRFVYFTTNAPTAGTTVSYYSVVGASQNIDTALKVGNTNNTDSKNFTVSVDAFASNGYKMYDVVLSDDQAAAVSAATGSTLAYYAKISKPSSYNENGFKFITVSGGSIEVTPIDVTSSSSIKKMPAGTYQIQIFKVDKSSGTAVETAVTVASFTVTDTQAVPTIVVNKTISAHDNPLTAVKDQNDVMTIKFGDAIYNGKVTAVEKIGTGYTVAVTKATINVDVQYAGNTYTLVQEVAVGATITLTAVQN